MDSRATLNRAGGEAPNGTVVARMCAVESNGRVIRDGENMEVRVGQFQLSVEIVDWQWCGCGQQQGSYLDFELSTEVPSGYKISLSSDNNSSSSNMPVKISLGTNDSFVMVSSKVGDENYENHVNHNVERSGRNCLFSTTYTVLDNR